MKSEYDFSKGKRGAISVETRSREASGFSQWRLWQVTSAVLSGWFRDAGNLQRGNVRVRGKVSATRNRPSGVVH